MAASEAIVVMKKFMLFVGMASAVGLLSWLVSIAWIVFYSETPKCTETSFSNRSGQALKSIAVDSDHMHISLNPDQNGDFQTVFIAGNLENAYDARMTFLFADGTTLKSVEKMIPGEKITIVIYKNGTNQAVQRADAW